VPIAHLKTDHGLAYNREFDGKKVRLIIDDEERKRIIEINRYLGDRPNALAEAKLAGSPMTMLIEKGSAKGEELMAAQEIEEAFMAISGAMMFKPQTLEKIDKGRAPDWSIRTARMVERYQAFANHWSVRKKRDLDYTLQCVIELVVDKRPVRQIAEDLGFHHTKIERAVLAGLRDYAVRAGWVDGKLAGQWTAEAEATFADRRAAA
jgi:hypothetical protein